MRLRLHVCLPAKQAELKLTEPLTSIAPEAPLPALHSAWQLPAHAAAERGSPLLAPSDKQKGLFVALPVERLDYKGINFFL